MLNLNFNSPKPKRDGAILHGDKVKCPLGTHMVHQQ